MLHHVFDPPPDTSPSRGRSSPVSQAQPCSVPCSRGLVVARIETPAARLRYCASSDRTHDPHPRGRPGTALVLGAVSREEGFRAESVATGARSCSSVWRHSRPDALVIDIGLPDADGRDVCQAIRAQGVQAPVLFLTARYALHDRLAGFSAGGDDYLTKPFAFEELVARLQALIRRAGGERSVCVGGLRLDPAAHAMTCGAARAALTPTEFRILARLLARARRGRPPPRPHTGRLAARRHRPRQHARRLHRPAAAQARDLPGAPRITTVHGVGYTIA